MSKSLSDLFEDTIKDIYNSEGQLLKAMRKLREKSKSERLKDAFSNHIGQTEEQVRRIEAISKQLGFQPTGKVCQGTLGIIKEADEDIDEFGESPVGDAVIIASAQKAEHYEISNYGTAIAWAEDLNLDQNIIDLLEMTLQEEEEADELLTTIAEEDANQRVANGRASVL